MGSSFFTGDAREPMSDAVQSVAPECLGDSSPSSIAAGVSSSRSNLAPRLWRCSITDGNKSVRFFKQRLIVVIWPLNFNAMARCCSATTCCAVDFFGFGALRLESDANPLPMVSHATPVRSRSYGNQRCELRSKFALAPEGRNNCG